MGLKCREYLGLRQRWRLWLKDGVNLGLKLGSNLAEEERVRSSGRDGSEGRDQGLALQLERWRCLVLMLEKALVLEEAGLMQSLELAMLLVRSPQMFWCLLVPWAAPVAAAAAVYQSRQFAALCIHASPCRLPAKQRRLVV